MKTKLDQLVKFLLAVGMLLVASQDGVSQPLSTVQFRGCSYQVRESEPSVTVVVERTGNLEGTAWVEYATRDGSARDGEDYIGQTDFLVFAPGETNLSVTIFIITDGTSEWIETFCVTLLNPNWPDTQLGNCTNATVAIQDENRFEFRTEVRVGEDAGEVTVEVYRYGPLGLPASVGCATEDGEATANVDYLARTGIVAFAAWDRTKMFTVPILNNGVPDAMPSRAFSVRLFPTNDPAITLHRTTVTIVDNDTGDPGFALETMLNWRGSWLDTVFAFERKAVVEVPVIRIGADGSPANVRWRAQPLAPYPEYPTAIPDADFTVLTGTLAFAALETRKHIVIPLRRDGVPEPDEWFEISLEQASEGMSLFAPSNAFVLIQDAERPGSVDPDFHISQVWPCGAADQPCLQVSVRAIRPQPDGKILIAGNFCTVGGVGDVGGVYRPSLARLNADGSVDVDFARELQILELPWLYYQSAEGLAVQSDGKIFLGGVVTDACGILHSNIVRLMPDGSVDQSFNASAAVPGPVSSILQQPDGKILAAYSQEGIGGGSGPNIVRLMPDGSADLGFLSPFPPDEFGIVLSIALQPDGKVLIAGSFVTEPGGPQTLVARLDSDGSLDASFSPVPGIGRTAYAVRVQSNRRAVVGVSFSGIIGLDTDGSERWTFSPSWGIYPTIEVQPDDKILWGYRGDVDNRPFVGRLNPDGAADSSFQMSEGYRFSRVDVLAVQLDGSILAGGPAFEGCNGVARLHGDANYIRLEVPRFATNGTVRLTLTTQPGSRYTLQASSDLTDWLSLQTNFAIGYRLTFEEATARSFSTRFYRALRLTE